MPKMAPSQCCNVWAGHSTPKTTSEATPDTQRPWMLLRGPSKLWRNERERRERCGTVKRGRSGSSRGMRNSWGHGGVTTCAASSGHIWVSIPAAVGICYHQRPGGHPWSGLLPRDMLIFESCAELAPPLPWALRESWPWKQENRGADHTLSQLQYLGEWDRHIAGVMTEPAPRILVWKGWLYHSSPCSGVDKGEIPSSLLTLPPSPLLSWKRPVTGVMRAGKLSLSLTWASQ